MDKFKSLVVLDIETSGLPSHSVKPKITELSMIGISREHIHENYGKNGDLPRVIQKLSACFYPKKMIHFEAADITGLDNMLLEEFPPWTVNTCILISSFLEHLPTPVCVVAHNGMKFDFPILKSEILVHGQSLSDDIMWADSLLAFKNFLSLESINSVKGISPLNPSELTIQASNNNDSSRAVVASAKASDGNCSISMIENACKEDNETTPKHKTQIFNAPALKRKSGDLIHNNTCKSEKARKQLFSLNNQPHSYKLFDIYTHIFDQYPPVSHSAEGDALSLLKCIIATTPKILPYFDDNHILFSRIPPMW